MRKWTTIPAAVLASTLLLAGCGGGSDPEPVDPPVTAPTEPTEPTGPTDAQLLKDAVDAAGEATTAMETAVMVHSQAVSRSGKTEVGMSSANGSSKVAYDNVMYVLGAEDLIIAEKRTADMALATLNGLDTSGMSQADQDRIMGLVDHAQEEVDAIQAILDDDDDSLADAKERVSVGTKAGGTPMERASQQAKEVAEAIETALTAYDLTAASFNTAAPEGVSLMSAGVDVLTAEDIIGGRTLKATGKVFTTDVGGATNVSDGQITDGGAVFYMGIAGSLECLGAAATCTATDGVVSGNVEFVPTDLGGTYVLESGNDGDRYVSATNYAEYGYWLDAANAIILHANTQTTAPLLTNAVDGTTSSTALEASYNGNAGGFSARTVGTGDNETKHSGEFTADVTLNATFSASGTMLAGMIDGFESADPDMQGSQHVNSAWKVELNPPAAEVTSGVAFSGEVEDNSDSLGSNYASGGNWNAFAFGVAGERPDGFVGAFEATFGDGSAAGVYSVD